MRRDNFLRLLFGVVLVGSGVGCLLLIKTVAVHLFAHMSAVQWRTEALGAFAWVLLLLILPVLGHGWAGFQWARRRYAAMCLLVLLAYAVPFALFAIEGEIRAYRAAGL